MSGINKVIIVGRLGNNRNYAPCQTVKRLPILVWRA